MPHVVLSGCSGGGKSTLLAELAGRGFRTVPEPGRRIVEEEQRLGGHALPWMDLAAFARQAMDLARGDLAASGDDEGWVFLDRGLIDAAAALQHATGEPALSGLETVYHHQVFLTPPWPEIYVQDEERQHGLDAAVAEYDRLLIAYAALGYEAIVLPRVSVAERADFILSRLKTGS